MTRSIHWARWGLSVVGVGLMGAAVVALAAPLHDEVAARRAALAEQPAPQAMASHAIQPQIVGGAPAPAGSWPFFVALMDGRIASNAEAHFCGGSLVGPRHVLTAAHCVVGISAGRLQLLVGTLSLLEGGRRINAKSITTHPRFRGRDHDVAVVELAEAVNDLTPAQFVDSPESEHAVAPANAPTRVSGYGATSDGGPSSDLLLEVEVPIVKRKVCNDPRAYDGKVSKNEICAGVIGEGGKDACGGDSGGPLVAKGPSGSWDTQVGVVSWGTGCARPQYPGVYARLGTLGAWVREQISAP